MLGKLFKNVFALVMFATLGYFLYTNFGGVWGDLYNKYFPCQRPIVYNLNSFDTRFGLSKKDFLADLAEAEKIWEAPTNKNLFTYDPTDNASNVVKVNLIYDSRQEATVKIRKLGLVVSDTRASYESLKNKYDLMQAEYLQAKKEYQIKVGEYKRGHGDIGEIRNMEASINQQVDDLNALVDVINNQARALNINVAELNSIGGSRGEEFTEGEYKEDASGKEIDIYEFSNKEKLIRVLAHELGHALGLDHVDDHDAIMYYLNENKNGKLAQADITAVNKLCKIN